jgi:hypothetical protein
MKFTESKSLTKGSRVYWRGEGKDSGVVTETSWNAVTIAWDNGKTVTIKRGDMKEIHGKAGLWWRN